MHKVHGLLEHAGISWFSSYMVSANYSLCVSGLPPRYRDSVRAITPGLPLFLYNYTTHQLHGIFEVCFKAVCYDLWFISLINMFFNLIYF